MYSCRRPEYRNLLLGLAFAGMATGCAYVAPVTDAGSGLVAQMAAAATADKAELAALRETAEARYRQQANAHNRMALALVLTAPSARPDEVAHGKTLLEEQLGTADVDDPLSQLARARLADVDLRLSLRAASRSEATRIEALRKQLDEANEKIDELLNIERSMDSGRRRESNEAIKP